MANVIHVTPQKITQAAGKFETTASDIKTLTTSMTGTVQKLSGRVWSGSAATAYVNKFNGLQDDINRLYSMVNKHATHLKTIARDFEKTETESVSEVNSLSSDVI